MTEVRVLEGRCENGHELDWLEGELVGEMVDLPAVVPADVVRLVAEYGYCTLCHTRIRLATEPNDGRVDQVGDKGKS